MRHSHSAVLHSLTGATVLLVLLAACQPRAGRAVAPNAGPPALAQLALCADAAVGAEGWQLVDDRAFEFRLPPAYAELKIQPLDSHARHFATPDFQRTLGLDYGRFSSTLDEYRASPDFAECRAEIGGHPARVVTARDAGGGYTAAATWRDLRPGVHLTVGGTAPDRHGQRELEAALRTMRFKAR
jgi:hypothetical protein